MTDMLPSLLLKKNLNNGENKDANSDLPVLSSNQIEPTVTQGKIDQIKLFGCTYIIFIMIHSVGTFLRSIRSVSC